MTIASSIYSVYKSDETIGLSDLLAKCKESALETIEGYKFNPL